jgi:hypothetical protein
MSWDVKRRQVARDFTWSVVYVKAKRVSLRMPWRQTGRMRYILKGKGFPLQAWGGPWGSRRLRLRIFSTIGTMKVVRSSPFRNGRLYPQEFSWYSFLEEESTPGPMVPSVTSEKTPATPLGIDPETLRLITQCLNQYATPCPMYILPLINSTGDWLRSTATLDVLKKIKISCRYRDPNSGPSSP